MVLDQPDLRPRNRKEYVLWSDYTYLWLEGKQCRLTIFKGMITDIASVPSWASILGYRPDGLHRVAALVHDCLYHYEGMIPAKDLTCSYEEFDYKLGEWVAKDRKFEREECDFIFYNAMLIAGVDPHHAWVMWKAVRLFGGIAW